MQTCYSDPRLVLWLCVASSQSRCFKNSIPTCACIAPSELINATYVIPGHRCTMNNLALSAITLCALTGAMNLIRLLHVGVVADWAVHKMPLLKPTKPKDLNSQLIIEQKSFKKIAPDDKTKLLSTRFLQLLKQWL